MSWRLVWVGLWAVSLGVAAVLIVVGLPWVTGTGWSQIAAVVSGVPVVVWLALTALWLAGLWAYTYVLTASLPGLTHAQALGINLAGTAVSNLLPAGGAFGVALTVAMARGWGRSYAAVAVSTLVSGVWNVLSRLALPAVALIVLVVDHRVPHARLAVTAAVCAGLLLLITGVVVVVVAWPRAAVALGGFGEWLTHLVPRRWRPTPGRVAAAVIGTQTRVAVVVGQSWVRLTAGMIGYLALQGVLFGMCLAVTGGYPGVAVTVVAFAVGRALTVIAITPNGLGVGETGAVAVLVGLGAPPGAAAAGVLLFALFTHVAEIPAGGVAWLAWLIRRGRVHSDNSVPGGEHHRPSGPST